MMLKSLFLVPSREMKTVRKRSIKRESKALLMAFWNWTIIVPTTSTHSARHMQYVTHEKEKKNKKKDDMTSNNKNIMPRNNLLSHFHKFSPFRFQFQREMSAHIFYWDYHINRKNVLCFQINHQYPSSILERELQYCVVREGRFVNVVIVGDHRSRFETSQPDNIID